MERKQIINPLTSPGDRKRLQQIKGLMNIFATCLKVQEIKNS